MIPYREALSAMEGWADQPRQQYPSPKHHTILWAAMSALLESLPRLKIFASASGRDRLRPWHNSLRSHQQWPWGQNLLHAECEGLNSRTFCRSRRTPSVLYRRLTNGSESTGTVNQTSTLDSTTAAVQPWDRFGDIKYEEEGDWKNLIPMHGQRAGRSKEKPPPYSL